MAINRSIVTIIGQTGRDPQIKFTKNGRPWVKFPVAVTERVKEGDQWIDGQTDWYEVVAWSNLAEAVAENITKGTTVMVQGRLKREQWTGDDGKDRVNIVVTADDIGIVPRSRPKRQHIADDRDFGQAPF